jgi:hypothetical protein
MLVELANYRVVSLETSLGKIGRDADGVVLRPTLIRRVEGSEKAEVVKVFWKGRWPRKMGPAKVLEFPA